jgi:oxidase EvaA
LQDSYFHRWLPFRLFAKFLTVDFLVNSAARSAICCTPWDRLVAHPPFSKARDGFDEELARSARAPRRQNHLQQLSDGLEAFRAKRPITAPVGLDELPGWQRTRSALESEDGPAFRLRHIRVYARSREVREWDQPILESAGEGQADLCCGRDGGVLHFAFRPCLEPGLRHGAELSPTFLSYPGDQTDKSWLHGLSGKVRLSCRQSDIGGRLFQDITLYRVVDIGEAAPFPGVVWLSLSEMMFLLPQSGWFSQEARTAISLLLSRI